MDITPFLDMKIAPRAVFDSLAERKDRPRFYVPKSDGEYTTVTWGAFADLIKNATLFLGRAGLTSGDRGAIFSTNHVEWIAAALAIQASGGVMVPIYPASTADQAAYIAKHCEAKVIFVAAPLLPRILEAWDDYAATKRFVTFEENVDIDKMVESLKAKGKKAPDASQVKERVVNWKTVLSTGAARNSEDPSAFDRTMNGVSLDQPGMMLYTSGTTGNPKGVPLTHANVAANGRDWLLCNGPLMEENAVDLLWLPMSHIFGFGEACLGNTLGFTTYLCDPASVMAKLPLVQPSVFMSVPSVWEKLAVGAMGESTQEAQKAKLASLTGGKLRFCLSGGAGLKREVKEFFHQHGVLIIEGYGLTETSPTLTLNRPDAFRFDTVGKPLPSVEIKLAEDGEILARGPNVFGGYFKDDDATKNAFTDDGWFKTGDVGQWTEDGFLKIVDRKKDILVTAGGKNVPPVNIEMRFADDPVFANVVVYGDAKKFLVLGVWLNDEVVAAELAKQGIAKTPESVEKLVWERIEKVNAGLAHHETIKKFSIMQKPLTVQNGLLTATLKVRRKKIYEAFHGEFEALYQ
ncbi:MAG: AMP-binding protein [Polyangiaceae bacterium]|nr:AMP-binding protein [Polyangiaceae bacterium]